MKKLPIPCQCGCSVVVFMEFDELENDPQEFFAEFYTMVHPTFWQRFKVAWKVFRGKDHFLHDVVMDVGALRELQQFLNENLPPETKEVKLNGLH